MIWASCSPFYLNLTNDQFQSIMKIIFYNIIYDDFQDFLYIHNFEIVEKKIPSIFFF